MAIDTRDKRLSVLGYGLPTGGPLPTPDATIGSDERRSVGGIYSGVVIFQDWSVRSSMMALMLPFLRPPGPYPEGAISPTDRQHIRGLYKNIAAASPSGTLIVVSHTIGRALGRALGRSM